MGTVRPLLFVLYSSKEEQFPPFPAAFLSANAPSISSLARLGTTASASSERGPSRQICCCEICVDQDSRQISSIPNVPNFSPSAASLSAAETLYFAVSFLSSCIRRYAFILDESTSEDAFFVPVFRPSPGSIVLITRMMARTLSSGRLSIRLYACCRKVTLPISFQRLRSLALLICYRGIIIMHWLMENKRLKPSVDCPHLFDKNCAVPGTYY